MKTGEGVEDIVWLRRPFDSTFHTRMTRDCEIHLTDEMIQDWVYEPDRNWIGFDRNLTANWDAIDEDYDEENVDQVRCFVESDIHDGRKISNQDSIIWFFSESLVVGNKSSKMTITREGRPMGTYPFRLFLVSSDSTYGQNLSSKALTHFGRFPRQRDHSWSRITVALSIWK
jgi:hypothetical protein